MAARIEGLAAAPKPDLHTPARNPRYQGATLGDLISQVFRPPKRKPAPTPGPRRASP